MGGSTNGSMMSDRSGYRWMMGGATAPDWMRGAALPASMTNRSDDPATVMGALLADAPGSRITPAEAVRLGDEPPTGGTVNQETHRVTLTGMHASVVVVMAPAGGPAQTFRAAGMADPTIAVTAGARVDIEVINADPDTAQGFEVTTVGPPGSPTTTDGPVFPGAALWFLGDPTAAGMHTGTVVFTAATPGSYRYVSPVPGQARAGMVGSFVVTR
jgi:FtsP/CotA-like multicopper oxidase with cupredoxin domain